MAGPRHPEIVRWRDFGREPAGREVKGKRSLPISILALPLVGKGRMNDFFLIQPICHPPRGKFPALGRRLATWLQSLGTSDRARPWRSGPRRRRRTTRWRGLTSGDVGSDCEDLVCGPEPPAPPPTLFGTLHPQNRVALCAAMAWSDPFAALEWWNSVVCILASRPLALALCVDVFATGGARFSVSCIGVACGVGVGGGLAGIVSCFISSGEVSVWFIILPLPSHPPFVLSPSSFPVHRFGGQAYATTALFRRCRQSVLSSLSLVRGAPPCPVLVAYSCPLFSVSTCPLFSVIGSLRSRSGLGNSSSLQAVVF